MQPPSYSLDEGRPFTDMMDRTFIKNYTFGRAANFTPIKKIIWEMDSYTIP